MMELGQKSHFMMVVIFLLITLHACSTPEPQTYSLLDQQITDPESEQFYLGVNRVGGSDTEDISPIPAQQVREAPRTVGGTGRKPTLMTNRAGNRSHAVDSDQTLTHRIPTEIGPDQCLLVGLRYGIEWDDGGAVDVRLLRGDTEVRAERCRPGGIFRSAFMYAGVDGADTIEVIHRVKAGPAPRLNMILTLRCPAGFDEKNMTRAQAFLRWVSGSRATRTEGVVSLNRLPVSRGGMKADGALLVNGTVEYPVSGNASGRQLRFGLSTMPHTGQEHTTVGLEAEVNGTWARIAEWVLNDQAGGWKEVILEPGVIPPRCRRVRFTATDSGDLVVLREPHFRPVSDAGRTRKNIILIDLDTLRADRLGCYGYTERPTSTRMDQVLEDRGFFIFKTAYSASPWTLPSTAKFFTSRYRDFHQGQRVPRDYTVLSEVLRESGYYCSAFTGGAALSLPGFEQGFHEYSSSTYLGKVEDVFPPAQQWLGEWSGGPFFLFLHTYETHRPYTRNELCAELPRGRLGDSSDPNNFLPAGLSNRSEFTVEEKRYIDAVYDSCVRTATDAVAELFDQLDELGLWESSIVIILSDHGEEFWDHFNVFGAHGHSLYSELLQVPLIIYSPDIHSAGDPLIDETVTLVDLMPTLLDLAGLTWSGPADGVSLKPLMMRSTVQRRIPILAQLSGPGPDRVCIIADGFKYIEPVNEPSGDQDSRSVYPYAVEPELYFLSNDPNENRNLLLENKMAANDLLGQLHLALSASLQPLQPSFDQPHTDIPGDVRRQLQGLGYLE